MTLPIARDLSKSGIRCMTIAPGIFGTPMMFGMPQEVQDSAGRQHPLPVGLGRPEDFMKLVHSIITNDMLNGETIRPMAPSAWHQNNLITGHGAIQVCRNGQQLYPAFAYYGLLRDIVIASSFGAGPLTDAFWVAFRSPTCCAACLLKARFPKLSYPSWVRPAAHKPRTPSGCCWTVSPWC